MFECNKQIVRYEVGNNQTGVGVVLQLCSQYTQYVTDRNLVFSQASHAWIYLMFGSSYASQIFHSSVSRRVDILWT